MHQHARETAIFAARLHGLATAYGGISPDLYASLTDLATKADEIATAALILTETDHDRIESDHLRLDKLENLMSTIQTQLDADVATLTKAESDDAAAIAAVQTYVTSQAGLLATATAEIATHKAAQPTADFTALEAVIAQATKNTSDTASLIPSVTPTPDPSPAPVSPVTPVVTDPTTPA